MNFPQRGFFGQISRSPDGRFTLAWRDANPEGTHGGARQSGKGSYLLLDGEGVVCEGWMKPPNDGKA